MPRDYPDPALRRNSTKNAGLFSHTLNTQIDFDSFRCWPKIQGYTKIFQGESGSALEPCPITSPWIITATYVTCIYGDFSGYASQREISDDPGSTVFLKAY